LGLGQLPGAQRSLGRAKLTDTLGHLEHTEGVADRGAGGARHPARRRAVPVAPPCSRLCDPLGTQGLARCGEPLDRGELLDQLGGEGTLQGDGVKGRNDVFDGGLGLVYDFEHGYILKRGCDTK